VGVALPFFLLLRYGDGDFSEYVGRGVDDFFAYWPIDTEAIFDIVE
jgi:hypothetical protein